MPISNNSDNASQNNLKDAGKRLSLIMPYLSNQWQYAQRLIGSQGIQPITQSNGYQLREMVQGSPVESSLFKPTTEQFLLSIQDCHAIDDYLLGHQACAFLVMWKDRWVHQFYHNFKPHYPFNGISLLKSLMAVLVGIAIDQGLIASVQIKAVDFLPTWRHDARREISMENLLSMQSGLKSDSKLDAKIWVLLIIPLDLGNKIERPALALPAVASAGRYFEYNNYTQLLGMI